MLRVARRYVRSSAVAEEVVQETWLGVLNGLERFEGRASLKTWIFRILTNRAISRAEREGRTIPMSSFEPAVDPDRFRPADDLVSRRLEVVPGELGRRCPRNGCSRARRSRSSARRSPRCPSASTS